MTAQQLIAELKKLDPNQTVNIAIRTFTQPHDVAYVETRVSGSILFACLPEGYVVSNRKPQAKAEMIASTAKIDAIATKRKPAVLSRERAAEIRAEATAKKRGCDLAKYRDGKTCAERGGDSLCTGCTEDAINAAIAEFPAEFGLRGFPGERFKISRTASYFSDFPLPGTLYLYTVVKRGERWESFCKGTVQELERQVVALPREVR